MTAGEGGRLYALLVCWRGRAGLGRGLFDLSQLFCSSSPKRWGSGSPAHVWGWCVCPPSLSQARGPKKHLKRVAAPKHWMLDKLTGVFVSVSRHFLAPNAARCGRGGCRCRAGRGSPRGLGGTISALALVLMPSSSPQAPRPSTGPHKLRECLPLIIFLRNRLKYALTGDEVKKICMQRFIKIDGKVRTDITYPAGFMGEWGRSGWGEAWSDPGLERKRKLVTCCPLRQPEDLVGLPAELSGLWPLRQE